VGWDVLTQGYLYRRKDQVFYLNCSAMPFIGVKTVEFAEAQADFKEARNAKDKGD
jgi:hypothetical protein